MVTWDGHLTLNVPPLISEKSPSELYKWIKGLSLYSTQKLLHICTAFLTILAVFDLALTMIHWWFLIWLNNCFRLSPNWTQIEIFICKFAHSNFLWTRMVANIHSWMGFYRAFSGMFICSDRNLRKRMGWWRIDFFFSMGERICMTPLKHYNSFDTRVRYLIISLLGIWYYLIPITPWKIQMHLEYLIPKVSCDIKEAINDAIGENGHRWFSWRGKASPHGRTFLSQPFSVRYLYSYCTKVPRILFRTMCHHSKPNHVRQY